MIPVARHLPNAYLRPLASDLPKAEPLGSAQPQDNATTDRVIEAEWRPISGPPVRPANVYRADSATLAEEASTLSEGRSPSLVAASYQQMTAQLQLQRGAILDIQA